jgi:nucleoid DNA-binding protein
MATKTAKQSLTKPTSKGEIVASLAEQAGLTRSQVQDFLNALGELVTSHLGARGPGIFSLQGLVKFKVVTKPAQAGGMRPNPFKPGEMMEVKPKPARKVVKALPLKALKDGVA